jgi:hypothetical protein
MDSHMQDDRLKLPKQTTPTWEMELLISGASVFALMQLPSWLNQAFLSLQIWNHDQYLNTLLLPLFIYVKVAVVSLAVTFLLHLCLRAYWVGLIGLDSVFPGGPKLDHMKYGPYFQSHLGKYMTNNPDTLIERADNRATMVFGFGVGLALTMIIPTVLVGIALAIALLLSLFLGSETAVWAALGIFLVPLMLLSLVPTLLDKSYGARIAAKSLPGKAIAASYRLMNKIHMDGTGNILIMYLYGQAKSFGKAAFLFAIGGMLLGVLSTADAPRLVSVRAQSSVVNDMETADYVSERSGNKEYAMRASIPAPRITGGWLDVTVPIPAKQPENDLPQCQDDASKVVTECMKKHAQVQLNNQPVKIIWQYQRSSDGKPPALRTMIDVRELPRGAHTLTIDYLPNTKKPSDAWQERILFWN